MAVPLPRESFQAVLLDIEGTTTPIEFVSEVLFPYARKQVKAFIEKHGGKEEVRSDLQGLWRQYQADVRQNLNPPPWQGDLSGRASEPIVSYVHWLMDQDRKATSLKSLQGRIWLAGYQSGELKGQVYADVPLAIRAWVQQKKDICIFSSGSVLAQKLLFQSTTAGDHTQFIRAYFDTTIGAKGETESYRRIAAELDLPPSKIVFVSDVVGELDAAQSAEMQTVLCVRPGRGRQENSGHPIIHSFAELF
ncbi:MAG: acireductone synthase [Candidatus Binatia bacterium]